MKLKEAQVLQDQILKTAYESDTRPTIDGINSELQSDILNLREIDHWNNFAIGYSFPNHRDDEVALEIRVPATSRHSRTIALDLQRQLGASQVNISFTKDTMITASDFCREVNHTREPLHLGLSVGSEFGTGSLGGFVKDDEENLQILSCSHVLAKHPGRTDITAHPGQPIYQPGPKDKIPAARNRIGSLKAFTELSQEWVIENDSACATLNKGVHYLGNVVPQSVEDLGGKHIARCISDRELSKMAEVYKLGKSSILTKGRISAINLKEISINVPKHPHRRGDLLRLRFNNVVEITPEPPHEVFSKPGDSGSLVFCKISGELYAVGLVFGVISRKTESSGSYVPATLVSTMSSILEEHNLTWLSEVGEEE